MSKDSGAGNRSDTEQGHFVKLVAQIYDDVWRPDCLEATLMTLRDAVQGQASWLLRHDLTTGQCHIIASFGCDVDCLIAYEQRCDRMNAWLASEEQDYGSGQVVTDTDVPLLADFAGAELLCNWGPLDRRIRWMGGVLEKRDDSALCVAVVRAGELGAFSTSEAALWRRVLPHLQRALIARQSFDEVEQEKHATLEALEQTPMAVFKVDRFGKPLSMNTAAEALIARADGLRLSRGRLQAVSSRHTARLHDLFESAAAEGTRRTRMVGSIDIPRNSSTAPLHVAVLAISQRAMGGDDGDDDASSLVLVVDPSGGCALSGEALRKVYGLTPSEVRLAVRLCEGLSIRDVADQLSITVGTSRNHLKRIFEKTGTKRQAELVRLLLSGPRS